MAEIEGLVRALREGDDQAKTAAARALGRLACNNFDQIGLVDEAGGIAPLVQLLRGGSAGGKRRALWALRWLACRDDVPIAEAGGIPLLVELLRDGSARAKEDAAWALCHLAYWNAANKVAIAGYLWAGAIPPLVQLLRDRSAYASLPASLALRGLAHNNEANAVALAVAIAVTVGLEGLVQLARSGNVTVDNEWIVRNAGLPAKRKAALVVSALLRDCVPVEARSRADVQDVVRAVIGPYL